MKGSYPTSLERCHGWRPLSSANTERGPRFYVGGRRRGSPSSRRALWASGAQSGAYTTTSGRHIRSPSVSSPTTDARANPQRCWCCPYSPAMPSESCNRTKRPNPSCDCKWMVSAAPTSGSQVNEEQRNHSSSSCRTGLRICSRIRLLSRYSTMNIRTRGGAAVSRRVVV